MPTLTKHNLHHRSFLGLLKSVEANAQFKGLHSSNLQIVHICAHRAARPMRSGRQRGRQTKRTHVEIVLQESVKKKSAASAKEKVAPKTESKKVKQEVSPQPVKKVEPKVAEKVVTPAQKEVVADVAPTQKEEVKVKKEETQ